MAPRTLLKKNNSGKLPASICNAIISILLIKGRFSYVKLSLKQGKYHLYLAQLSLQSLSNLYGFLRFPVIFKIFFSQVTLTEVIRNEVMPSIALRIE